MKDVDPRTAHQLLGKAKAILKIEVGMMELKMEANLFQKKLDSLMKKDHSFVELVQKLEVEYRNSRRGPSYVS
ncbi:hypothetical protein KEJ39_01000 [Candidatus Bathyarchaeota archaeon]|nr:hypothetical protein [Candidatus Bathyarchaeota archaeon]